MKKILLEFPLYWGENKNCYQPSSIWLKVVDNHTEAFKDKDFKEPIPKTEEKISLEIEVPKNLEVIEVVPPGGNTPTKDIAIEWAIDMTVPRWHIPGLRNVVIIFDNMTYEVGVVDEKPDIVKWRNYIDNDKIGKYLCFKKWALAVYTMKSKTIAKFHWHSMLAHI